MFAIIDRHTGKQVGKNYKCRKRANRRIDILDNEYGGYKYYLKTL